MIAIAGGKPDRVPSVPDFSNMIPCRLTGKPFWDIYLYNKPALFEAYCKAVEYFGTDGWNDAGNGVVFRRKNAPECSSVIVNQTADRIVQRVTTSTPAGDLREEWVYLLKDPPTKTEKMIKDIEKDFIKIKYLYGEITGYDASRIPELKRMTGDNGIFTLSVCYPGFQIWNDYFNGNLMSAIYAYDDHPEIFDEWREIMDRDIIRQAEIILDQKPDVLLLGGSGTITLASPELARKYALPTIKTICRMAKEAGILTMLHSCGKSLALLDMLVNEMDLDCINPLEEPPMGDVNLADVKKRYGGRISLLGNLHTTTVMLRGTPEDVEKAARKAIEDAGEGGGFLLSTGDQCGRDTPDANIFKLVETARTYGKY
jgi:uroporphyrinogen decarboxylase